MIRSKVKKDLSSAIRVGFAESQSFDSDIVDPPFELSALCRLLEDSSILRQNVDAYSTNIDSFGVTLQPTIDLSGSSNSIAIVKDFILQSEKRMGRDEREVSDDEVKAVINKWTKVSSSEFQRLNHFLNFINSEESFVGLRMSSRQDLEVMGNWTWEVIRNRSGEISRIERIPFFSMRISRLAIAPTLVNRRRKIDSITYQEAEIPIRFRRFVQKIENHEVWFKEFGDTRILSRETGTEYGSEDDMFASEGRDAKQAFEVLHYTIPSPWSVYGVPRWIGSLRGVIGSKDAEQVNLDYFSRKGIPPFVILVTDGRLNSDTVTAFEEWWDSVMQGTDNFHTIPIIEAESSKDRKTSDGEWSGRPRISFEKLADVQQKDALFIEYDKENRRKVAQTFRNPPMLLGDTRDLNRSTGQLARSAAEEQVYQPERNRFDEWFNRTVISDMGIRFWTVQSNAPQLRDPERLSEVVTKMIAAGVMTPNEARALAPDLIGRELSVVEMDSDVGRAMGLPLPLTVARERAGLPGRPPAPLDTAIVKDDDEVAPRIKTPSELLHSETPKEDE